MAQSDTVDRILDTAEILFAEKGFSETSLRMITSKAKVNLAAVNYHFGSKNVLVQSVFSRFLHPFTRMMEEELSAQVVKLNGQSMDLDTLLGVVIKCVLKIPSRHKNGVGIFMRLLGLAYTQSQGHLRRYLETEYEKPFHLFMKLLREATPELSAIDRFWKIQFMLGATAFTMSSVDALDDILFNELGVKTSTDEIMNKLVPFLAAGLRASVPDIAPFMQVRSAN
jgi:AcrR family transcriptional regulator